MYMESIIYDFTLAHICCDRYIYNHIINILYFFYRPIMLVVDAVNVLIFISKNFQIIRKKK